MSNDVEVDIVSTLSSILDNSTSIREGVEVIDDFLEHPEAWQTWIYGLSIVSITAFTAPLGIMLTPLLNKSLYEKVMTFLVALGIGAMSGSCLFILLPHAFNINQVTEIEYLQKCLLIAGAIFSFFAVDRSLQCLLEIKRRRQNRTSTIHTSTFDSITRTYSKVKKSSIIARKTRTEVQPTKEHGIKMNTYSANNANVNDEEDQEKEQLRDEIDVSNCTNSFLRTLSTRYRTAVIKTEPLDKVQYQRPDGKILDVDTKNFSSPASSKNVTPLSSPKLTQRMNGSGMKAQQQQQFTEPPTPDDKVSVNVEIHEKHVIERVEIASVAYMIIFGSSMNNFVDGMSIGAAFSDSVVRGLGIGIAVMSEQLPQELGTLAILINSGLGLKRTLIFSIVPMLLSFGGFSVGVFLDNIDDSYDGLIFSISAGMYLYIVLGTLLPEIREQFNEQLRTDMSEAFLTTILQAVGIFIGLSLMFLMNLHNEEI